MARVGSAPLGIYADPNPAFDYYTARPLRLLRRPQEVADFVAAPAAGYCVMKEADFTALSRRMHLLRVDAESVGHRTFVLAAEGPGAADQATTSPR